MTARAPAYHKARRTLAAVIDLLESDAIPDEERPHLERAANGLRHVCNAIVEAEARLRAQLTVLRLAEQGCLVKSATDPTWYAWRVTRTNVFDATNEATVLVQRGLIAIGEPVPDRRGSGRFLSVTVTDAGRAAVNGAS